MNELTIHSPNIHLRKA